MKHFIEVEEINGGIHIAVEDICAYHKPSRTITMACVFGTQTGLLHLTDESFEDVMTALKGVKDDSR